MSRRTAIFIGAHFDDIEIQMGGLFAKLAGDGWRCIYVVATNTPHYNLSPEDRASGHIPSNSEITETRRSESRNGANILGASEICFWDFKSPYYYKPGTLDRVYLDGDGFHPDEYEFLIKKVEGRELITSAAHNKRSIGFVKEFIRGYGPELIVTHTPADHHWEHYATCMLVRNSVKALKSPDMRLYACEDASHDPVISCAPTHIVDISAIMDKKLEATRCFLSQNVDHRIGAHPEYVEGAGRFWGAFIGVQYGEPYFEYEPLLSFEPNIDMELFWKAHSPCSGGKPVFRGAPEAVHEL